MVMSAVMHAWAVVRSTEVSRADVVMSREVGCFVVSLDGSMVACQTHTETLHLLGCGCGCGSSLGAGFGDNGTKFGHNAAHHVGALGVGIVGAKWNRVDGDKRELCRGVIGT